MFVTNNLQSITLYIDFRLEHNTSTVKHDWSKYFYNKFMIITKSITFDCVNPFYHDYNESKSVA